MAAVDLRGGSGTALRRNRLLGLLVLVQTALNARTFDGSVLVFVLTTQICSA